MRRQAAHKCSLCVSGPVKYLAICVLTAFLIQRKPVGIAFVGRAPPGEMAAG